MEEEREVTDISCKVRIWDGCSDFRGRYRTKYLRRNKVPEVEEILRLDKRDYCVVARKMPLVRNYGVVPVVWVMPLDENK